MTRMFILVLCILFSQQVQAAPIYVENFISPPGQFPANHGSSILELPGGQFLTCWYAGSKEKGTDVQIQCSHYDPVNGWEAPRVAVKNGEKAKGAFFKNRTVGNAVLYRDDDGVIWLFYSAVTIFDGWSGSHVDYKISKDLGETWSESHRLVWFFGNLTKNKPIPMGDHKMMLPLYHELFGRRGFTCTLTTRLGEVENKDCSWIYGSDELQPTLVQQTGDRVLAYMRSGKSKPYIRYSEYLFKNGHWGKSYPTNLPNPDAGIDAVLTAEGQVLMAYNPSEKSRSQLSLAVSSDGKNFTKIWDFDQSDGGVSYPAMIRASDGMYHITYTYDYRSSIKHLMFNEEWLRSKIP